MVSILICISLLLSITSPLAYATNSANTESTTSNIFINENVAVYTVQSLTQSYCIYLDTVSGNGSFAVIYANNSSNIHEYCFSLSPDQINASSSEFWALQASHCLSQTSNWNKVYVPNAISSHSIQSSNIMRSTTADTYFNNWLYDKFGAKYNDRIIGYPMKQSQLFYMYQSLDYYALKILEHNINYDMTVSAFLLSFFGSAIPIPAVGVVASLFGGLATSIIPAGSRLDQYDLSVYYHKYLTVQGGNIIHASAEKQICYTGFARATTDFCCVDEGSAKYYYHPTEEYFEDTNTLLNAAWEHLHNP